MNQSYGHRDLVATILLLVITKLNKWSSFLHYLKRTNIFKSFWKSAGHCITINIRLAIPSFTTLLPNSNQKFNCPNMTTICVEKYCVGINETVRKKNIWYILMCESLSIMVRIKYTTLIVKDKGKVIHRSSRWEFLWTATFDVIWIWTRFGLIIP